MSSPCVSDSSRRSFLQQPVSRSVQPGHSVTLDCTVTSESCHGQHSVYWFRSSAGSQPGIVYASGDGNAQCEEMEMESATRSCVYLLPKKNLTLSDAGTYYCAVASCGEILFGNGTRVDVEGKRNSTS